MNSHSREETDLYIKIENKTEAKSKKKERERKKKKGLRQKWFFNANAMHNYTQIIKLHATE